MKEIKEFTRSSIEKNSALINLLILILILFMAGRKVNHDKNCKKSIHSVVSIEAIEMDERSVNATKPLEI